jgi:hypothetical protein
MQTINKATGALIAQKEVPAIENKIPCVADTMRADRINPNPAQTIIQCQVLGFISLL